jgi:hypothetical protein
MSIIEKGLKLGKLSFSILHSGKYFIKAFKEYSVLNKFCDLFYRTVTLSDKTWSDVLRLVRLIVNSNFHTGASLFPEILPKLDHLVQKLLAGNECIPLFWVLAEVMVIPGVLQHRRGLCIFIIFS